MLIEINKTEADKSFSKREKFTVWILLTLMGVICPFRYTHQFQNLEKELKELMS